MDKHTCWHKASQHTSMYYVKCTKLTIYYIRTFIYFFHQSSILLKWYLHIVMANKTTLCNPISVKAPRPLSVTRTKGTNTWTISFDQSVIC